MKKERTLRIVLFILFVLAGVILIVDLLLLTFPSMKDFSFIYQREVIAEDTSPKISPLLRKNPSVLTSSVGGTDEILDSSYENVIYSLMGDNTMGVLHTQGACSDGTYIWSGSDTPHSIRRLHILTGETFSRNFSTDEWLCGHINDMTYNPYTNKIYVSAFDPDDYSTSGNIVVINPDTLLQEEVIHLQRENGKMCPVHGIAYDRLNRCYYTPTRDSRGCGYAVFNDDFQYIRTIMTTRYENFVLQGIETDGKYIYRSLSAEDGSQWFAIYDFNGSFIKLVLLPVPYMVNELEVAMYDWNGNWFANVASHATTLGGYAYYRIGFQSDIDYSAVEDFHSLLEDVLIGKTM